MSRRAYCARVARTHLKQNGQELEHNMAVMMMIMMMVMMMMMTMMMTMVIMMMMTTMMMMHLVNLP